jgi:hypothetical protein
MIDFYTAQVRRHRQNVERYCRLLATELTDLERQYLHKRIAEEYAQLRQLEKVASRGNAPVANNASIRQRSCRPARPTASGA